MGNKTRDFRQLTAPQKASGLCRQSAHTAAASPDCTQIYVLGSPSHLRGDLVMLLLNRLFTSACIRAGLFSLLSLVAIVLAGSAGTKWA
jgi:hypothetical protein